jgi:two-component system response regulator VanR
MKVGEIMTTILVVDDEKEICDLVALYLLQEEFIVHKCYDGASALQCLETETFDLAILDVMLPDIDGFSICKRIRENYTFPIIMLTAKENEVDKITGLTLGADDYITKPFRPLELIARVKAQLRRFKKYNTNLEIKQDTSISIRGLFMNFETHECFLDEKPLSLTPLEFSILQTLVKNSGKVLSVETLFFQVWGEKYYTNSNNTIMVHIRHLREKMNDSAEQSKYIKTVWGVGYKIEK